MGRQVAELPGMMSHALDEVLSGQSKQDFVTKIQPTGCRYGRVCRERSNRPG
jgi:hypothetical protein